MHVTRIALAAVCVGCAASAGAAEPQADLGELLSREIIEAKLPLAEVKAYCEPRIPRMPKVESVAQWEAEAVRLRREILERVVFRGQAAAWRDAKTKVEWLGTIAGGPGYHIKKLRYEALPGLWIPALLYEPEKLAGKVPAMLAVNGHEREGKAVPYKQLRCINLAKRGMLAMNLEWLGMGQLSSAPDYLHYHMNQLDLCGASGLAPFFLCMQRGLDILLAHENADPERVAVSGLSGGGWQTIVLSSLDTRVKLANPVAGYSSFRTRTGFATDLGDSEQTPCDFATVADYAHLTAMMAPRPTLLTYNSKDTCCFKSDHALPPLLDAAGPIFALYGRRDNLRSHVNDEPGDHNFGLDNRQAFYRMLGDHFYAASAGFDAKEIPSDAEVKKKEELDVELPSPNASFNTLALALAKDLPRDAALPAEKSAVQEWQQSRRQRLREIVRARDFVATAEQVGRQEKEGVRATFWRLKMGDAWTVPVVELVAGQAKATAILVGDAGRKGLAARAKTLLDAGSRVLAVDPFFFGESKIAERDFLFALLVSAVGDRPLGLQASQLAAVARWSVAEHKTGPVTIVAAGERSSTFSLVAAALEADAIGGLELHRALGSLKEVIEQNGSADKTPELFCFGLLERFDVKQIAALVAPRPVRIAAPSDRARSELSDLKSFYKLLGVDLEPLK